MKAAALRPLVGDLRQFASVRPVVLEDGAERGQRALLFSTGGGLDFSVLPDRSMDIGTLQFRGLPLAWQSPAGLRSPFLADQEADAGRGFNRSLSGFLVTCGLEHIRQPSDGSPLHGRLPGTPARLLAQGEDWDRDEPILYAESEAVQAAYGREHLRLRRRIEAPVGGTRLSLLDRVENGSGAPGPHALLYHMNFGYPGIGPGTTVSLDDVPRLGPLAFADPRASPAVTCLGAGPAPRARCTVRPPKGTAGVWIEIAFDTQTLPFVQFWTDMRPGIGVLAVEPCTTDRRPDGTSDGGILLEPGEVRNYRIDITFAERQATGADAQMPA